MYHTAYLPFSMSAGSSLSCSAVAHTLLPVPWCLIDATFRFRQFTKHCKGEFGFAVIPVLTKLYLGPCNYLEACSCFHRYVLSGLSMALWHREHSPLGLMLLNQAMTALPLSPGVDSINATPARPGSSQSFSQARPVAFSPAHQQSQHYSQLPPNPSMRPVLQSQRQPSPAHMQQRRILAQQQQQPVRATQRPLHFTTSQAGSQVLTPQSSQTQRSSQAYQHSQAGQGSQAVQLQSSQAIQMSCSQDLLMLSDSSQLVQHNGRNAETRDNMLAQTTCGMHTNSSQGRPSSQLEQGSPAMPQIRLTQPFRDTFAWSEETQADPPLTVNAATDSQAMHQCTVQQGLLESAKQPVADPSVSEKPAQRGDAIGAAAAGPVQPSRLRMKMKSLAAAAAINNAESADYASAANSRQQDTSALPLSLSAPAADQSDHSGQHLANLPDDLNQPCSTEQAAAVEAGAEAAKAAASQAKQAMEAATAAQDECKTIAASAAAAATAAKEGQEAGHVETLSRITGVQGSCTILSSAVATLQSSCDIQAGKLSAVESTCQTVLGLLHALSAQTQQAVVALETCQVQQPAVTVLRLLESATQTSPVRVSHEAVQAELSPRITGPSPWGDKVLILLLVLCMQLGKASISCQ